MAGPSRRPLLIVVSAPSGAGKSTLCDRLLAEFPNLRYSISCTTRAPRGREVHGRDYYFLSVREFEANLAGCAFLEHARVHDHAYGTLRSEVERPLAEGLSVVMDIDVQGAAQIREFAESGRAPDLIRRAYVDIFIKPPSLEVLRQRLVGRGEDAPDVVERRLKAAEREMAQSGRYRYTVVNDDLERAYGELRAILLREWAG